MALTASVGGEKVLFSDHSPRFRRGSSGGKKVVRLVRGLLETHGRLFSAG